MKIELLWNRERFAEIFADAVDRLIGAEVRWLSRPPLRASSRHWLCADRLNAIYWVHAGPAVRAAVRRHYGNHPSTARAALQRLYVAAATTGPGERALSRWLTIDPTPDDAAGILFRGGGQRIRMMDYEQRLVSAVAKAGRSGREVTAEIAFRRDLPEGFPAPELYGPIDGGRGLREELVAGRPLDQLRRTRALDVRAAAERRLGDLAQAGRRAVDARPYVSGLAARVDFALASELASAPLRNVVTEVFDQILERVGGEIDIAPCHGDLTGDNIIASGASFAITDWETAGERHVGFTWIEGAVERIRAPNFAPGLIALIEQKPGARALASASRLIASPPPVFDRAWRETAVLAYLAERLVIDAGTALSPHLHRAGPELAIAAKEAGIVLEAVG